MRSFIRGSRVRNPEKTEKFEVHPVWELVETLGERERREMTERALQAAFLFSGKKESVLLEEFHLIS